MKPLIRSLAILLVLLVSLAAFGDDQQKAQKELNKITALATASTGRTVVNLSMAETFSAKRSDLVIERRDTGLNYGQLFVMHALIAGGANKDEIVAQVKSGKSIFAIADAKQVNWKQIAEDAKKLNAKIDQDLYQRFLDKPAGVARDQADGYLLTLDGVIADKDVAKGDLTQAQERFLKQKDRAEGPSRAADKPGEDSSGKGNVSGADPGGIRLPPPPPPTGPR